MHTIQHAAAGDFHVRRAWPRTRVPHACDRVPPTGLAHGCNGLEEGGNSASGQGLESCARSLDLPTRHPLAVGVMPRSIRQSYPTHVFIRADATPLPDPCHNHPTPTCTDKNRRGGHCSIVYFDDRRRVVDSSALLADASAAMVVPCHSHPAWGDVVSQWCAVTTRPLKAKAVLCCASAFASEPHITKCQQLASGSCATNPTASFTKLTHPRCAHRPSCTHRCCATWRSRQFVGGEKIAVFLHRLHCYSGGSSSTVGDSMAAAG